MADVLTALTALAVSTFRKLDDLSTATPDWFDRMPIPDRILKEAHRVSLALLAGAPPVDDVVSMAFSEPELSPLATVDGELDPMLLHPAGGTRTSPKNLITGLLASAFLQIFFFRRPLDEGTFVRTVLEGYEELRRAARGERVRATTVTGISGVTLPDGAHISTPWGIIRPAPPESTLPEETVFLLGRTPKATCILAQPHLVPVKFDRGRSPKSPFDSSETGAMSNKPSTLLPLACALSSKQPAEPTVPRLTWSTFLLPFQAGLGYSIPTLGPTYKAEVNLYDATDDLEGWARIVETAHTPSADIAARRLVSAVASRTDRTDALIDAVMVWENLVGTESEVSFRVTAALAKLIEREAGNRRSRRKNLRDVYDVRSRVVHGRAVDGSTVNKACSDAIEVAVRAMRASYLKGRDWLALSSEERSNAILLEWP